MTAHPESVGLPAWAVLLLNSYVLTSSGAHSWQAVPEPTSSRDGAPRLWVPSGGAETRNKANIRSHRPDSKHWGQVSVPRPDEQSSRPFVWFPLAGKRHAIVRDDRQVEVGEAMRCLCGDTHPRGVVGDMEWVLWKTCAGCWEEACRVVEGRNQQ